MTMTGWHFNRNLQLTMSTYSYSLYSYTSPGNKCHLTYQMQLYRIDAYNTTDDYMALTDYFLHKSLDPCPIYH